MSIKPLLVEQLRRMCDPSTFPFADTSELDETNAIFGQPRGISALEFGIGIRSRGYNIYVLGETGTGRTKAITRFLREKTRNRPTPLDWVYVHNFKVSHEPRAIEFPAGQGAQFKKQMAELVTSLREDVPKAFGTEEYEDEVDNIWRRVELKETLLRRDLERRARKAGFQLVKTASGMTATPVVNGDVMTAEQFSMLTLEQQEALDLKQQELETDLELLVEKTREIRQTARKALAELERGVAEQAIAHHVAALTEMYADHEEVLLYLSEVHDDVLENLGDFRPNPKQPNRTPDLRRYEVNMFVDNSRTEGPPVVVEQFPTYNSLLGRIEYEMRDGVMSTHFTNIKPGSLHLANGGYLLVEVTSLMRDPNAWEAVKRSIRGGEIVLRPSDTLDGSTRVLAKTIDPEAIPLDIKIILQGSEDLYYALYEAEEDFNDLFKVKADFSSVMKRDLEHEMEYARFIAMRCHAEKLPHFDRSAVARVVEFGSELCGNQNRLTANFSHIADLVHESAFWAQMAQHEMVCGGDVQRALDERVQRSNKLEMLMDESIEDGQLMLETSGAVIGQLNGLTVLDLGDYSFGRPSRITGRTFSGGGGVVHIEREVDLADPIHNKGVLIMTGYMGGQYAQDIPMSFSASLTFEQNYMGIAGDSASSTELYVLLSSLAEIPLAQGIGVTGSINQRGQIQPIGGVTEKVEGFFRVCKQQGLTGKQGVIIPSSNVTGLMLHPDVLEAVETGDFSVWAISTIDEGLEILTGMTAGERDDDGNFPDGTLHHRVEQKLMYFAKKNESSDESDEQDEDESAEAELAQDPAHVAAD